MTRGLGRGVAVLVCLLTAGTALGQTVTFEAVVRGEARMATVEVIPRQGVDYVSLTRLIEQYGGAHSAQPRRMSLDFAGTKAWVQVNDNRVNAMKIFALVHPIVRLNDDMCIAKTDVPAFFGDAFNVTVRSLDRSVPQPPAVIEPAEPEELLEPAAPEETPGRRVSPLASRLTGARPPVAVDRPIEVIVIDAGHGGYDTGLEGREGLAEKDVALAIALRVEELLASSLDMPIVMTRRGDVDVSMKERAYLANQGDGDLLISIHAGGAPSPGVRGSVLIYPSTPSAAPQAASRLTPGFMERPNVSPQSAAVARALARALSQEPEMTVRGVESAPLRLMNQLGIPGVVVEVGCLTNPEEEALLQSEDGIARAASGIAKGIAAYVAEQGSGRRTLSAIEPE